MPSRHRSPPAEGRSETGCELLNAVGLEGQRPARFMAGGQSDLSNLMLSLANVSPRRAAVLCLCGVFTIAGVVGGRGFRVVPLVLCFDALLDTDTESLHVSR
jgi:hypothetical protein